MALRECKIDGNLHRGVLRTPQNPIPISSDVLPQLLGGKRQDHAAQRAEAEQEFKAAFFDLRSGTVTSSVPWHQQLNFGDCRGAAVI